MSLPDRSSAANRFQMPDTFSFGLEERATDLTAIKLEFDDYADCDHKWFPRDPAQQTLRHEGKTVLECRDCKRSIAVYDWKLEAKAG